MHRRLAALASVALVVTITGSALAVEPSDRRAPIVVAPSEPDPTPTPTPTSTPAEPVPAPTAPAAEPAGPAGAPSPALPEAADARGTADPTGRWIVLYHDSRDAAVVASDQGRRLGFTADRTFRNAVGGFSARLGSGQVAALRKDPRVAAVVPDERIELTGQVNPTGISRTGVRLSSVARVDNVDERIDADVAIVDTGVASVADLNVAGGYNCSTSDRSAWRDRHGHGTHVAGTVGAIDNGIGVVGVAPGVRIWGVKILDDSGAGLLSWYVCGLDWIAAQRDPGDPSRPLFESVNMSVAKNGRDDGTCGVASGDILHAAICRLVDSGVTVVAAAANDSRDASTRVPAAYDEVITVSALADTDGRAGGLGGKLCFSWGSYDDDDTFANFSNYGADVDLIAPGKCIWSTIPSGYAYMSGTSMAAPHVAGAVALLRESRPGLSPAEVKEALQYLGNLGWKVTSDPDPIHEKLLDVSNLGPRGDFAIAAGGPARIEASARSATIPITVTRSETSFERITFRPGSLPRGVRVAFDTPSVFGFGTATATMHVTVAPGLPAGTYQLTVLGLEHGIARSAEATIVFEAEGPQSNPPDTLPEPRGVLGSTTLPVRVAWPAATPTGDSIAGYEVQSSVDGGAWTTAAATTSGTRTATTSEELNRNYRYRVRARDASGTWGAWATGAAATPVAVQDNTTAVLYGGRWTSLAYSQALGGTVRYASVAGASARTTFSGRSVALVAPVGPTRGSARIYVDGVLRDTVSFASSQARSRNVMFTASWASVGTHTIEVRLTGSGRVDLDAFVIQR